MPYTTMRTVKSTHVGFLFQIKGKRARRRVMGDTSGRGGDTGGGDAVGGHIHSTLEIKGITVGSPMSAIVNMHV